MFSKRIGHEPRRLHFLDEFAERESRGLATALRHAHCLLNDHEPFAEQPKSRDLPGVGFQLLFDARGDFEALLERMWQRKLAGQAPEALPAVAPAASQTPSPAPLNS